MNPLEKAALGLKLQKIERLLNRLESSVRMDMKLQAMDALRELKQEFETAKQQLTSS